MIEDIALMEELFLDHVLIFGATVLPVIVLFVLFNLIPKTEEKDYRNIKISRLALRIKFGTYQKASVFYFPLFLFFTLAMNEQIIEGNAFYLGYASASTAILQIYIFQLIFLAMTTIPLLLVLRTKKLDRYFSSQKIRIIMGTYALVLLLIISPFLYQSHLNNTRLNEYINNFESQGIVVIHSTNYFGGKTNLTEFYNLTEVIELVKIYDIPLYLSNGANEYHLLTFPRHIQIWFYPPEGRVSIINMK